MNISDIIKISTQSNVANSCRRIFFNHLYNNGYEDGFHVDVMHGAGSGIILFFDGKFFLLTARHVIEKSTLGTYQNSSPFWVPVNKKKKWESLYDFMFPKYYYDIGKLIKGNSPLIDDDDVCLIELFHPMPFHTPDHFIDLTNGNFHLKADEFYDGQFLIANGYPFALNDFDHDFSKDGFTHSTNIIRHSVAGICILDGGIPHISYEITDKGDISHDGMSGGVVCNAWDDPKKVKWAGLILSGSQNITRFLPAYRIYDAILSYKDADMHIIDPAADAEPEIETALKVLEKYFNDLSRD